LPFRPQAHREIFEKMDFTEEQIERYSRHIILPEVGGVGQAKLLKSKVFVLGAGGLGSPALLYLAAAGVGTIGIADADVVDLSNLQRQVIHKTETIGMAKVLSAKAAIESLNPDVKVEPINTRLNEENIREILREYDVVLDGSDNFPTRFLMNDAAYFEGKPLVSGSMFRFDGQISVFKGHDEYPCYRCLYPEPPPKGLVPSCQEAGVLGALAGVIGVLQAVETIKELLGIGDGLAGKLMIFDALDMSFRKVKVRKDPECALCGPNATIKELKAYEEKVCEFRT
jgi:adenylyltransferase/sulfurtransferase